MSRKDASVVDQCIIGERRCLCGVWVCSLMSALSAGLLRTERNVTNWSSDKLKSLILGLSVENEEGSCEVTEVSKLEGEASINNRKGKLIFFYEWNLKATWTGK